MVKFLLLQHYEPGDESGTMRGWTPGDIRRHLDHQRTLEDALMSCGELVEAVHLTGPGQARLVGGAALPSDRPLLAEYRIVDVPDERRALEIAALLADAPGPGGPRPVEVRPLMVPEPLRES